MKCLKADDYQEKKIRPLKILITGSSGLVGSHLSQFLRKQGHEIFSLVRRKGLVDEKHFYWDPEKEELNPLDIEGMDAVVHLAGESIMALRWTQKKKDKIRDSRVRGTKLLADTLAKLEKKPEVFVSASAVGYYGDRGNEVLDESSEAGEGFLAEVAQAWELASQPATKVGIRVVNPRIGIVLTKEGGALAQMLPAFKMGLAGVIGSGKQYMAWISLEDLVSALYACIIEDDLKGAVNCVAPHPVPNRDFTKSLGRALNRPTLIPLPATAAKLLFGEMADEMLLASMRLTPSELSNIRFDYKHPQLDILWDDLFC